MTTKHPALALNGVRWSKTWIFRIRLDSREGIRCDLFA